MKSLPIQTRLLVAVLLVASAVPMACAQEVADAHAGKRSAIARHAAFFREAYTEAERLPGSPRAWQAGQIRELLDGREDAGPRSTEEWVRLLGALVEDSVWGYFPRSGPYSGVVQHDEIVDVLVGALRDGDKGVRRRAAVHLVTDVSGTMRGRHAKEIREALGFGQDLRRTPGALFLFVKCGATAEQKAEILTWANVSSSVRALCGDKDAEADFIARFRESAEFVEKDGLATTLGLLGTPACAEALVDGLRSHVCIETPDGVFLRSIRISVLQALGRVYDDEKLFTTEAAVLGRVDDEAFDRKYDIKRYAAEVDRWVRERFGRGAWGGGDLWFSGHRFNDSEPGFPFVHRRPAERAPAPPPGAGDK